MPVAAIMCTCGSDVRTGAGHLWGCLEKTKCCNTWEDAAADRVGRGHSNPWHKPAQNTRLDQVN